MDVRRLWGWSLNAATAVGSVVLVAVVLMAISTQPERDAARCAERWAPYETQWHYRNGCTVYVDNHWTPERNITVYIEGQSDD